MFTHYIKHYHQSLFVSLHVRILAIKKLLLYIYTHTHTTYAIWLLKINLDKHCGNWHSWLGKVVLSEKVLCSYVYYTREYRAMLWCGMELYYVCMQHWYVWHFTKTLIRQVYILISGPLRKLSLRPKNLALHQNARTSAMRGGEVCRWRMILLVYVVCTSHTYQMLVQKTWFICLPATDGGANYFSPNVYFSFLPSCSNLPLSLSLSDLFIIFPPCTLLPILENIYFCFRFASIIIKLGVAVSCALTPFHFW